MSLARAKDSPALEKEKGRTLEKARIRHALRLCIRSPLPRRPLATIAASPATLPKIALEKEDQKGKSFGKGKSVKGVWDESGNFDSQSQSALSSSSSVPQPLLHHAQRPLRRADRAAGTDCAAARPGSMGLHALLFDDCAGIVVATFEGHFRVELR